MIEALSDDSCWIVASKFLQLASLNERERERVMPLASERRGWSDEKGPFGEDVPSEWKGKRFVTHSKYKRNIKGLR